MGNQVLRCCVPESTELIEESSSSNTPATNLIELAASELFSLPGVATAYHTSILVNGEEFFFTDSGIFSDRMLNSHQGQLSARIECGYSQRTGSQLLDALSPFFRSGTYDLVRKNCNSFSDCALYYLLRRRLDKRYSSLEKLGQANLTLLQSVTKGMYSPNPAAEDFEIENTVESVGKLPDPENQASATKVPARHALIPGSKVTIIGLQSASNLNGQGAVIARFNAVNGRWEARLNISGEVKAFRAENLRPAGELALEPGSNVRVHSLASSAGQELNDKRGIVVRYMHDVSRYEINIGGQSKALKAENLQITSTAN